MLEWRGKPDARPGTDASSRAIFTNQWVAVPEQELLLLSQSGLACSARLGDPGGSQSAAPAAVIQEGVWVLFGVFLPTPTSTHSKGDIF